MTIRKNSKLGIEGHNGIKVSVVIPCYNQGRFLPEAVESLLRQTHREFEVIIVNDGSTDDTENIARGLKQSCPEIAITILSQKNSGPSTARNNAIEQSHGEYIFTLDADDRVFPETLEKMTAVLDAEPKVGLVYSDYRVFGAVEKSEQCPPVDYKKLLERGLTGSNILFRKKAWKDAGGYNPNMREGVEDWDFTVGVFEAGWKFAHIPEELFLYRKDGLTRTHKAESLKPKLKSQIILNHPGLYGDDEVEKARKILSEYEYAETLGTMTDGPLISIVLTAGEENMDRISECLQRQSYRNLEILVCGMGAERKGGRYTVRTVPAEPGADRSQILNRSVQAAGGEYVSFLTDGDRPGPEHYSALCQFLTEKKGKLCHSEAREIYGRKGEVVDQIPVCVRGFSDDPAAADSDDYNLSCFLFRKEVLKRFKFDESLEALEGMELLMRILKGGPPGHVRRVTMEKHRYYSPPEPAEIFRYIGAAGKTLSRISRELDYRAFAKRETARLYRNNLLFLFGNRSSGEILRGVLKHPGKLVTFILSYFYSLSGAGAMGTAKFFKTLIFDRESISSYRRRFR